MKSFIKQPLAFIIIVLISLPALSQNNHILVFGDSLSAAYNIPKDKGWVSLIEKSLSKQGFNTTITNASISGETTTGGLTRFKSQIKKTKPNIVILELGANDGLRGASLKNMSNNLSLMIDITLKSGAKVILAGMHIPPNYGRTYTKRFDQVYLTLSEDERVILIPFILDNVASIPKLIQKDGLHPNEQGQPIIVNNVLPYLIPLLNK